MAVGIVLVAALLRFSALDKQPLWYDELISMSMGLFKGGLAAIWKVRYYPHPPLFPALQHLVLKVFAPGEFSVRLLAAFGGVLGLPFLYRYTTDRANKRIALIGMLLLAFSPFHIFYSQDGRPYSLMFALVLVTVWVLHKALESNRVGWWVLHFACLLALLYLHFFNWAIVGGEMLYMLIYWRRYRRSLAPFALSLLAVPLAISPLLSLVRDSLSAGHVMVLNATPISISFPDTWRTLVAGELRYVTPETRLYGVLAFGFLALVGIVRLWRDRPRLLVLILSMFAVPFVFVFVVLPVLGQAVPPYEEKMFMVVLPFALILAASGAESLWVMPRSRAARIGGSALALALLAILLGGNLLSLKEYYTSFEKNLDARVVERVESYVQPGDIVICDNFSSAMNFKYHWDVEMPLTFVAWPRYEEGTWQFSTELNSVPEEPLEWDVSLDDALSYPRVWLVSLAGFSSAQLAADLEERVPPALTEEMGPFSIRLFIPE
jgi:uncharacterized membrane protein